MENMLEDSQNIFLIFNIYLYVYIYICNAKLKLTTNFQNENLK